MRAEERRQIPIPHPGSAGMRQLSVTPDGKTVVYHEPNFLALLSVEDNTFSLAAPLQGPIGPRTPVACVFQSSEIDLSGSDRRRNHERFLDDP